MRKQSINTIAIVLTASLLTGCAGNLTKQGTGTALGALAGAGLAYGLGKDSGKKDLWLIAGAAAGAMAGNAIGAQLDERDRLLLGQTTQQTLEKGQDGSIGSWKNPNSGNSGTITPTQTHMSATGTPCREFVQTIYIGGKPQEAYGTACRQADGSWKIQQG